MTPEQIAAAQSAFPDPNAPPQPGPYVGAYGLPSPQLVSGAQSAFDQNNAPNMIGGGPVPPMPMMSQQPPVSAAQAAFDPVPPSPPGTPPLAPMVPTGAPMRAEPSPAASPGAPAVPRTAPSPGVEQQYRMAQADTNAAYKDQIKTQNDITEANRKANEAKVAGNMELAARHEQNAKELFDIQQVADAHAAQFEADHKAASDAVKNYQFDPFKNEQGKGIGSKLAFIIGAALGGALQGMGKTSGNTFLEHADHLVDTETKRQQMEYEKLKGNVNDVGNRYAYYMKKYGDARQALVMTQNELGTGIQAKIEAAAAQSQDPVIKANGDAHASELATQLAQKAEADAKVNRDQARAAAQAAANARAAAAKEAYERTVTERKLGQEDAKIGIDAAKALKEGQKGDATLEKENREAAAGKNQLDANLQHLDFFRSQADKIAPSLVEGVPLFQSNKRDEIKAIQDRYEAYVGRLIASTFKSETEANEPKNMAMIQHQTQAYIPHGMWENPDVTRERMDALKQDVISGKVGALSGQGVTSPFAKPSSAIVNK